MGRYFKEQEDSYDKMNKRINYLKNLKSLGEPTPSEIREQTTHASIANVLSKDLEKAYDNGNLQSIYTRFSEYYNRNIDSFDDNTMEIFNFIKDDFVDQYNRNTEFRIDSDKLELQRQEVMEMIGDYDDAFAKTSFTSEELGGGAGFGPPVRQDGDTDKDWQDKQDYYNTNLDNAQRRFWLKTKNNLQTYTKNFKDFEMSFKGKYNDRIGRGQPYDYLHEEFQNQQKMLSFVWGAAETQGAIDSSEAKAIKHFLDTGDTKLLSEYDELFRQHTLHTADSIVKQMNIAHEKIDGMTYAIELYEISRTDRGHSGGVYLNPLTNQSETLRYSDNPEVLNANKAQISEWDMEVRRQVAHLIELEKKHVGISGQSYIESLSPKAQSAIDFYKSAQDAAGFISNVPQNQEGLTVGANTRVPSNEESLSNINSEENVTLKENARKKGHKNFVTSDGKTHLTRNPNETDDDWVKALQENAISYEDELRFNDTQYQNEWDYQNFNLPSAQKIIEHHTRADLMQEDSLWGEYRIRYNLAMQEPDAQYQDINFSREAENMVSENPELAKATTKPKLDDIIMSFMPSRLKGEEIEKSWGFGGLNVNPASTLQIAAPKDWALFENWIKDVFVHSHKGKIGRPQTKLVSEFIRKFKTYMAYHSNEKIGPSHERTNSALSQLKQIYNKLSIGIKSDSVKGIFNKGE